MKKNNLFTTLAVGVLSVTALAACGPSGESSNNSVTPEPSTPVAKEEISMWVGQESVEFYQKMAAKYCADNPDFPYSVRIIAADTGAAAAAMITDNHACADVITIAHDNIGKLSQKNLIAPIGNKFLLDQIEADNPEAFKKVIRNKLGGSTTEEFVFGVPYISQALFLYYNKKYVTPEQALTFEGLTEAAKKANKKAFTVTGLDSFNFSFSTLAVRDKDKYTSTKIYENFEKKNCFFQGNDTIAIARWAQDIFADPNGGMFPTSSGYIVDMQGDNNKVISVIGGAWQYDAIRQAVGTENLGCAMIPTFTLSADHVAGLTANEFDNNVPKAGDVYRGGTFADCKVFAINMAASQEKTKGINKLLRYFSSKEIQNLSFLEAGNVPAYSGADVYIDSIKDKLESSRYEMARSQIKMAEYGIAQPFLNGILNTYFYSKGADSLYKGLVINDKGAYEELPAIRTVLYNIEHTWVKGKVNQDVPANLPAAIA